MAEIKRIQLRGISRSPSDRLTEDGGVAESLNVFLDNTEVAPLVQPRDVTEQWNYPKTLKVDYSFIHKTANYERLIVSVDHNVGYLKDGELENFLELLPIEDVAHITALGNTLVISTTQRVLYVLYKDGKYEELGTSVPFPQIKFSCQYIDQDEDVLEWKDGKYIFKVIPSEEEWNGDSEGGKAHTNAAIKDLLSAIKSSIQGLSIATETGCFSDRVFIRYTATLYDGTKYSSMPILVDSADKFSISMQCIYVQYLDSNGNPNGNEEVTNRVWIKVNGAYRIKAELTNLEEFKKWGDVVKSVDFYVSQGISSSISFDSSRIHGRHELFYRAGSSAVQNNRTTDSACSITLNAITGDTESLLQDSALTYKVKSIALRSIEDDPNSPYSQDFLDLAEGIIIKKDYSQTELLQKELLSEADMKHYPITAASHFAYNNQLLLLQPTSVVDYGYNWLNNQENLKVATPVLPENDRTGTSRYSKATNYELQYVLRADDGSNLITEAVAITADIEAWYANTRTYSFQTFPDARCYRMIVKAIEQTRNDQGWVTFRKTSYADLPMKPHPYLDCAYHYETATTRLIDLCTLEDAPSVEGAKPYDARQNGIYVSAMDNPFMFPDSQKFTLPGEVLGGAVATYALSQGQFGQFPLYVFTREGIYAMEIQSDGTFLAPKPVTRDVCINPSSITSIDQAVVFVSEQGVMLLKGSEAANISPYMLREPQQLSDKQMALINTTEHSSLVETAADQGFFMDYMKTAKVMYDYAGKRLIFTREDKLYQYVYKLDTQTWHKMKLESLKVKPLNSYPEALALVEGEKAYSIYYKDAPFPDDKREDFDLFRSLETEFNKNFNHAAYGYMRLTQKQIKSFLNGTYTLDVTHLGFTSKGQNIINFFQSYGLQCGWRIFNANNLYDFSQVYNDASDNVVNKGLIITRPFDLGCPDVLKTITDIRVRGQFPKGSVKFILEGSNDGYEFHVLNSLRTRSWKLFRLTLLSDFKKDDRISWVDIMYETRFTNKLR